MEPGAFRTDPSRCEDEELCGGGEGGPCTHQPGLSICMSGAQWRGSAPQQDPSGVTYTGQGPGRQQSVPPLFSPLHRLEELESRKWTVEAPGSPQDKPGGAGGEALDRNA